MNTQPNIHRAFAPASDSQHNAESDFNTAIVKLSKTSRPLASRLMEMADKAHRLAEQMEIKQMNAGRLPNPWQALIFYKRQLRRLVAIADSNI